LNFVLVEISFDDCLQVGSGAEVNLSKANVDSCCNCLLALYVGVVVVLLESQEMIIKSTLEESLGKAFEGFYSHQ